MKYDVEDQNVTVFAGRIGGYEYVAGGTILLVSINVSQRSSEVQWERVAFRNVAKDRIEQFSEYGDHLTVIARKRVFERGNREIIRYGALQYYIGRRVVQSNVPQANQNADDSIPDGLAQPHVETEETEAELYLED